MIFPVCESTLVDRDVNEGVGEMSQRINIYIDDAINSIE